MIFYHFTYPMLTVLASMLRSMQRMAKDARVKTSCAFVPFGKKTTMDLMAHSPLRRR
jgi:hypothetical protein